MKITKRSRQSNSKSASVTASAKIIYPFKMIAKYEDSHEAEVGGFDEADCMDKLVRLTEKHGDLTWYSGVTDEDYVGGEYVGQDNFIYSSEDAYEGSKTGYYRISHKRDGVYQALLVKANSRQEAEDKYRASKPDGEIIGISPVAPGELETCNKKGMPVLSASDEFDYWDDDEFDEDDRYEQLDHKMVPDSDGFMTDYTLYYDPETDTYFTMFGDTDLYPPDPDYADYECDSEKVAREWFDSYTGFDEDDDDDFSVYSTTGPIL